MALVKAVATVQPNTVVILNNGSAVAMSEWIADAPFGRVNPSGKLAETFPLRVEDTPSFLNLPGENGTVRYGEGIFVGYRTYDTKDVDVLFPFGYGLSYTTFEYPNLQVSAESFKDTVPYGPVLALSWTPGPSAQGRRADSTGPDRYRAQGPRALAKDEGGGENRKERQGRQVQEDGGVRRRSAFPINTRIGCHQLFAQG